MLRKELIEGQMLAWKLHTWYEPQPVKVLETQAYSGDSWKGCAKHQGMQYNHHVCPGKAYTKVQGYSVDEKGKLIVQKFYSGEPKVFYVTMKQLVGPWDAYHEAPMAKLATRAAQQAEMEKVRMAIEQEQKRMNKVIEDLQLRINAGEFPGLVYARVADYAKPPMPVNGKPNATPGYYRLHVTEKTLGKLMELAHA